MFDSNTITKGHYIVANVIGMLWTMLLYQCALFCRIPGLIAEQSNFILWTMSVGLTALGVCLTYKRRRNNINVFSNVLFPFEIYAIITYYYLLSNRILCFVIFAVVLAISYSILLLLGKGNRSERATLRTKIRYSLLGSRTIIAVCLAVLLFSILYTVLTDTNLYTSETTAYEPNDTVNRWYEDDQVEAIKLLTDDAWNGLNIQERINVLGVIVNIEAKGLAINHQVSLESGVLSGNTLAEYRSKGQLIVIDCSHIGVADSNHCVEDVCHEVFHAYQHQQVELLSKIPEEYKDMPMFDLIKVYDKEFQDYCDGSKDYERYYNQEVESQARIFGENSAEKYMYLTELYNRDDT